jgi:hypothetical protein
VSVLSDAIALVREAEALVIGKTFRPKNRLVLEFVDSALHGPWFVIAGMQNLLYVLARWVALLVVFSVLLIVVSGFSSGGRSLSAIGVFSVAATFSAGAILFGLPSGFTTRGVKESHVFELAQRISSCAQGSEARNLLRLAVEEVGAIGRQRISAISWAIGLMWAALAWIVSEWVLPKDVSPAIRGDAVSYGFLALLALIGLAIAFVSYRESHRLLSQTITFAFLEAEADVAHRVGGPVSGR